MAQEGENKMEELKLERISEKKSCLDITCPDDSTCFECATKSQLQADQQVVDKLKAEITRLEAEKKEITNKERGRVHTEINKMLEPLQLHLCWITSTGIASEQYGLADKDGDDVDFVTLFEPVLKEYLQS
jgi:hypothetical protein